MDSDGGEWWTVNGGWLLMAGVQTLLSGFAVLSRFFKSECQTPPDNIFAGGNVIHRQIVTFAAIK